MRFEIESGKKNVKWVKQHLILNWEFKFSEVLKQCNIPKPPIDVLRALTSYPIPDNLDQIKLDSVCQILKHFSISCIEFIIVFLNSG